MDEGEQTITDLCEGAVRRLVEALPSEEIGCLLRHENVLRHRAHAGRLGLIFEIPREQGGVAWRAVEQRRVQLVPDVRADPDYLASDAIVRSEIAAPIKAGDGVVGVIDVEFPGRVFEQKDVFAVEGEARRLGEALLPYFS